jgi:hypothetical protein
VDKSAIYNFERFLNRHRDVRKWLVAADFSLGSERPHGCFAFTVVPYDAWPWELERDAVANLARDLKKSKSVPESAVTWLRDNRRFHFAITVRPNRAVFVGGVGTPVQQAREHVNATLAQIEAQPDQVEPATVRRIRELARLAQRNSFNVKLLTDMWLLAVFFAAITTLIGRERQSEIISWFPDRDNMTNWCDGVWHDYAFWNTRAFADAFQIDLRRTQIGMGLPDRRTGKEVMWFDYLVRAADWFAGAVAEWDRKTNLDPKKHPKYREMWEQVIADADNVIVLHLDIDNAGAQFRRIGVQRANPTKSCICALGSWIATIVGLGCT